MATAARREEPEPDIEQRKRHQRLVRYFKALGPGMIAGASDNDPTTVATIAVIGSTTQYRLSWLTILIYPMLSAIQIISARIGAVTKRGLQTDVAHLYGRGWGFLLLLSVVIVNVVTLAADLEGGSAAVGLLFHLSYLWFVIPFALGVLLMLMFGSYRVVQRILKWVLLVFVAYVFAAFAAHPNWSDVLHHTLVPSISFNKVYVESALALLGTTLTGYAYVWETIEEAEEKPPIAQLGLVQADAGIGMLLAVAVFWFILIATGATLGAHHTQVQTAQQAAQALVPAAGPAAGYLFAVGLLASAILAVPVLAATNAYVVGSQFGWRTSLSHSPLQASPFYLVLAGSLLLGVIVSFAGISPIRLLFVASLAGGLGTPISMFFLLLVGQNRRLMGDRAIGRVSRTVGWATLVLVSGVSLYFLWQQFGAQL